MYMTNKYTMKNTFTPKYTKVTLYAPMGMSPLDGDRLARKFIDNNISTIGGITIDSKRIKFCVFVPHNDTKTIDKIYDVFISKKYNSNYYLSGFKNMDTNPVDNNFKMNPVDSHWDKLWN